MFGKKPQYREYFPTHNFIEAVRAVVDGPRPTGPTTLFIVEEDSLVNADDLPASVKVIYIKAGSPVPVIVPPIR